VKKPFFNFRIISIISQQEYIRYLLEECIKVKMIVCQNDEAKSFNPEYGVYGKMD